MAKKMKNMSVSIMEMDNGFRLSIDEQGIYGSEHRKDLIAATMGEAITVAMGVFTEAANSRKETAKKDDTDDGGLL